MCFLFGTDPSMCWYLPSFLRCAGAWRVLGRGDGVERGVASRRVACKRLLLLLLIWEMDGTRT